MELICQGVWGSYPRPMSAEFAAGLTERCRDPGCGSRDRKPDQDGRPLTYGGDTSCLEVRLPGDRRLILDAGTGLRKLDCYRSDEELHVLLTHLHVDHVAGLTLCPAVWQRKVRLVLHAMRQPHSSLWSLLNSLYRPPLWPVQLRTVLDRRDCNEFDADGRPVELDVLPDIVRVRALPVRHTDPTVAYRIDTDGASLVFAPDHEGNADADRFSQFAAGASLLIHDSQYLPEELPQKEGWGHSSYEQAISVASQAGVETLLLWHHDPSRTDRDLDELGRRAERFAREQTGGRLRVLVAYDGLQLRL